MKQANKFLAKGAPETVCPHVGDFNFDPKIGTFQCKHPHSSSGYCELNEPSEWEDKCPHLQETKSAMKDEHYSKESLGSRAMKFLKENMPSGGEEEEPRQPPLKEEELPPSKTGSSQSSSTVEPTSMNTTTVPTLSQFMLDRVGMAVKGPYVQYYYFTVEDFNTILTSIKEAERTSGGLV